MKKNINLFITLLKDHKALKIMFIIIIILAIVLIGVILQKILAG